MRQSWILGIGAALFMSCTLCGNGVVDAGETCDGGNGCDSTCNLDGPSDCNADPSICGAGTECDAATGSCVPIISDCTVDGCTGTDTCNAATGLCEPVVRSCLGIDGVTEFIPTSVGGSQLSPGAVQLIADLQTTQFSNAGTGLDTVLHVNLPATSDLLIRTLTGAITPDTVLVVRSGDCNVGTSPDVVVDDLNINGGQAAAINLRSLAAGDYFIFVDTKSATLPVEPIQIEVRRTQVISTGNTCNIGLATQRCADGLACLAPAFTGNVEITNTCAQFVIPNTRLFAFTDDGISELNPANGTELNSVPSPFQLSGTPHYALAYDDLNHKLFVHDSASTAIDDPDGDGLGPDVKNEVLLFNADTLLHNAGDVWPTSGLNLLIEGLAFNRTAPANQQLSVFDANLNRITVLDPATGTFSFDYGLAQNNATVFAGLGVDGFSTEQANTRGYVTKSDVNQVQEFVLGVGGFLRTVSAPPLTGIQCGLGVKGDFAFVGYDTGLIRVVTAINNISINGVPSGLVAGSFVTEYLSPGLHACGIDAGGL